MLTCTYIRKQNIFFIGIQIISDEIIKVTIPFFVNRNEFVSYLL